MTTAPEAAILHRRYGRGQVVSIGVAGLWRWALSPKVEGANSPFDRFWDQMILWLLAGRDFIPNRQYSFRPNSANILLGEKVYFRLVLRQPDPKVKSAPVTIYFGDALAGRVNLAPAPSSQSLKATPLANDVSIATSLVESVAESAAHTAVEGSGVAPFLNHSYW